MLCVIVILLNGCVIYIVIAIITECRIHIPIVLSSIMCCVLCCVVGAALLGPRALVCYEKRAGVYGEPGGDAEGVVATVAQVTTHPPTDGPSFPHLTIFISSSCINQVSHHISIINVIICISPPANFPSINISSSFPVNCSPLFISSLSVYPVGTSVWWARPWATSPCGEDAAAPSWSARTEDP